MPFRPQVPSPNTHAPRRMQNQWDAISEQRDMPRVIFSTGDRTDRWSNPNDHQRPSSDSNRFNRVRRSDPS